MYKDKAIDKHENKSIDKYKNWVNQFVWFIVFFPVQQIATFLQIVQSKSYLLFPNLGPLLGLGFKGYGLGILV